LSTGNFTFPPDGSPSQINLSVSASIASGSIVGVTYTFFGSFAGAGLATFSQAADAAPTARGSFSSSSFSDFSAVSPASALNLSTTLNIFDQGDSAAISEVRFQLATVPEPGTITLLASGLGLLAALRLRRRASQSKGRIL
jgi:hypothetical protein